MSTTKRGVDLTITAELFPEGTVYGGGPATYRYPDAGPVEETPTPATATALAELGSTGTAIEWATTRGLLTERDDSGQRIDEDHEDWNGEIVDRFVFEGSMTLDQWREFAELYLISIHEETGEPDAGEYAGDTEPTDFADGSRMTTRSWDDWSGSMDWNVGGLSKVSSARAEITMWEMTEYGPDECPSSPDRTGPHVFAGSRTCEECGADAVQAEPYASEDVEYRDGEGNPY